MEKSVKEILADDFWIMPATPEYKSEGIPYITSKNIKNGSIDFRNVNYISKEDYESISKNRPIQNGDILISMIGTLGETAEVTEQDGTFYGQNMFLVRLDNTVINKRYFLNYFQSNTVKRALAGSQNQSTQKYLKANHIEDLQIPVPNIEEQEVIAQKLDLLSKVIAQRKLQLDTFDYFIKARFVEMFGRPEDKKYPSVRLGNYAKLQGGYAFKSKDFVDEGVPLVQIGNVNKDYLDWDVINAVPEEYIDKYSEFALSKDDLVMAMTRPIIKSLGSVKIAKVAEDDLPCLLNQRVGRFQIKDKIHPVFLEILCKTNDFKDYVERMSGNSLQPNISSKQVEDYIIILPPIELQEIFAEFVKQVDKSKVVALKAA